MNLTGDQLTAFQSNSGFSPTDCSVLLVSLVFVVVLIWGVWALRTAYAGWAARRLSNAQFLGVAARFAAMYVVLTFLLLS
ncbi:TIGR03758 family integrating conjugative element protein [Burkholderia pseudomallei]|uniref:TIGR03758 family integrating conjugative element protein n=1 Tax=Burkholderia pseudomallei TaxID=28450 RepID=UPI000F061FCF|nr:TIGR03758 family integrating conjugative element protein [Burkholderia pseudomallei]MBF3412623.1 TIGR03758 family integrating conjugative element protein [Burkholderia pseudomallei]MBF3619374.1 TIGR03758 family integrating conjugative element protein [Burkholderia pseudomallei]CAJ9347285.1 integrating conjugative element protein, PFL_4701 family [Burkholderia pseudomallei]VBN64079.1 integrating conjugative element protein, PFL_4701 family [Burkholderia pseudomallei]